MNKDRYPTYGVALLIGAGVAIWLGLPPALLLLLLVCPLMMVFMMRGMHGGDANNVDHSSHGSNDSKANADALARRGARPLDGSHERIDKVYE